MAFSAVRIIEKKRDGGELAPDEIGWFTRGIASGEVADYQAAAFAMAVFFRGMNTRETADLTAAFAGSGARLRHPPGHPPVVDKHSTGGVGDKVSLVLAPLLAADGNWVPMVSGRGLGATGGTLDKLESIPGLRTGLEPAEIEGQLAHIGIAMAGQSAELCPADRKLYALRDVTATVPSKPLIVASIMGKKLAESLDRLVLDVKFGSGAFMKSQAEAEALADGLLAVAREAGLECHAILNPMDQPLGYSVGNVLEVREALDALAGRGPRDLEETVLGLAARVSRSPREALAGRLRDGSAMAKFEAMVAAQGGDLSALDRVEAAVVTEVRSPASGLLLAFDAGAVGRAAVELGAGRRVASDRIDPAVGFDQIAKTGTSLRAGDVLARVHAATAAQAEAGAAALLAAVTVR
jgi:pyrimidine-nucleoside phosphorylase